MNSKAPNPAHELRKLVLAAEAEDLYPDEETDDFYRLAFRRYRQQELALKAAADDIRQLVENRIGPVQLAYASEPRQIQTQSGFAGLYRL